MDKGWIGVDLDGTLAYYDEWRGIEHIGEPIWPMVNKVKDWIAQGVEVKIFTARIASGNYYEIETTYRVINNWCYQYIGNTLEVTNVKDHHMVTLYDDRCVQVEKNTGRIIGDTPVPEWKPTP